MDETISEYTATIDCARAQARRKTLAAQLETAKIQYDQLEHQLALLQRNMDAMYGGLQELDALLKEDK